MGGKRAPPKPPAAPPPAPPTVPAPSPRPPRSRLWRGVVLLPVLAAVAAPLLDVSGISDAVCDARAYLESPWAPPYAHPTAPHHSAEYNSTMLWGTYRPHLYFGMRTRTPQGVLTGITWGGLRTGLRHTAEGGGPVFFSWSEHDGVGYGRQAIIDAEVGLKMTVTVVKRPRGTKGGDWAVRFRGHATEPVLFGHYLITEGQEAIHIVDSDPQHVALASATTDLGAFVLLLAHRGSDPNATWMVRGKTVARDPWDLMAPPQLRGRLAGSENVIHCSTRLHGSFVVEAALVSHEGHSDPAALRTVAGLRAHLQSEALLGCPLTATILQRSRAFARRFDATLGLRARGLGASHMDMARSALSNYLGGMGYWYGEGIQYIDGERPELGTRPTPAAPLFSGVPSRAMFPRGFLWDEGFHQLLLARWDEEVAKDVILHWLHLIGPTGWIPREQILGPEPRTRVPAEFVPQNPTHANPPTLTLQIQNFALDNADGRHTPFLERAWPYLERWFEWFRTSQSGASNATFRWRGRSGYHLLACGLDDYPRSACATEEEAHVDLYSWVTLMASTIQSIGAAMGRDTSHGPLATELTAALNAVHWDPRRLQFSDRTGCPLRPTDPPTKSRFLAHFGYVNLFPVLTGIADPDTAAWVVNRSWELMSGHGLRSLREQDARKLARSDNYWTGPVWINLNYLMLRALHTVYRSVPGAADLYRQLREDLIATIVAEHQRTGKLWENYNATTGRGRGTSPFTGWTILVVLIMEERY